jgi:hypothetical protein
VDQRDARRSAGRQRERDGQASYRAGALHRKGRGAFVPRLAG